MPKGLAVFLSEPGLAFVIPVLLDKMRNYLLVDTGARTTFVSKAYVLANNLKLNHHDAIDMVNGWSHSTIGQMGASQAPGISLMLGGQRLLERAADGVLYTDLNACNQFTNGVSLAAKWTCHQPY